MKEKKLVALTFDDGPTIGITDQVLDVLQENQVTASFFLIGQQITPQTEYLVKRAHDMGCTIENHSKTHQFMPKQSEQEIVDEIKETSDRIEKIVGEKPEFFRPPYIDYDQKMYDLIDLTFISGYGCEDWLPEVSAKERTERLLKVARPVPAFGKRWRCSQRTGYCEIPARLRWSSGNRNCALYSGSV